MLAAARTGKTENFVEIGTIIIDKHIDIYYNRYDSRHEERAGMRACCSAIIVIFYILAE